MVIVAYPLTRIRLTHASVPHLSGLPTTTRRSGVNTRRAALRPGWPPGLRRGLASAPPGPAAPASFFFLRSSLRRCLVLDSGTWGPLYWRSVRRRLALFFFSSLISPSRPFILASLLATFFSALLAAAALALPAATAASLSAFTFLIVSFCLAIVSSFFSLDVCAFARAALAFLYFALRSLYFSSRASTIAFAAFESFTTALHSRARRPQGPRRSGML